MRRDEVALDAAFVLDDVRIGEELRRVHGHAGDLVDAVAAVLELTLPDQVVEEPGRRLPGDEFLPFETGRAVPVEAGARLAQPRQHFVFVRFRLVIELAAVEIERRVVDEPELGEDLRRVERELQRDLVDVVVEAHRGEPEPHRGHCDGDGGETANPREYLANFPHRHPALSLPLAESPALYRGARAQRGLRNNCCAIAR